MTMKYEFCNSDTQTPLDKLLIENRSHPRDFIIKAVD